MLDRPRPLRPLAGLGPPGARRVGAWVLGVLLAWLVGAPGGISAARADQDAAFDQHLSRAVTLYKQRRYDDAIGEFQAAYAIRQLPRVLLNIGQAYRKLGRAQEALRYYEHFLRVEPKPDPKLRADLMRYMAQTRAMLQAPPPPEGAAAPGPEKGQAEPSAATGGTAGAAATVPAGTAPAGAAGTPTVAPGEQPGLARLALPATATRPPPLPARKPPIYRRWWFWTTLGLVTAGAIAAGVAVKLATPDPLGSVPPDAQRTVTF